jgi:hypothetical protein
MRKLIRCTIQDSHVVIIGTEDSLRTVCRARLEKVHVIDYSRPCVHGEVGSAAKGTWSTVSGRQISDGIFAVESTSDENVAGAGNGCDGAFHRQSVAEVDHDIRQGAFSIRSEDMVASRIVDIVPGGSCEDVSQLEVRKVSSMDGVVSPEPEEVVGVGRG